MATSKLVWNPPPARIKALKIPHDFEATLKTVLQEKWVEQDWNLRQITEFLAQHHDVYPSKRQLTNRIAKWEMLKKNRLGASTTLPTSSEDPPIGVDKAARNSFRVSPSSLLYSYTELETESIESENGHNKLLPESEPGQLAVGHAMSAEHLESQPSDNFEANSFASSSYLEYIQHKSSGSYSPSEFDSMSNSSTGLEELSSATSNESVSMIQPSQAEEQTKPSMNHDPNRLAELLPPENDSYTVPPDVEMIDVPMSETSTTLENVPTRLQPLLLQTEHGPDLVFSAPLQRMVLLIATASGERYDEVNVPDLTVQELLDFEMFADVQLCCGWTDKAGGCYKLLFHCWRSQRFHVDVDNEIVVPFLHMTTMMIRILQTKPSDGSDKQYFELWRARQQFHSLTFTCAERFAIEQLAMTLLLRGYGRLYDEIHTILFTFDEYSTECILTSQCKCNKATSAVVIPTFQDLLGASFPPGYDNETVRTIVFATTETLVWIRAQLPSIAQTLQEEIVSNHFWQQATTRTDIERMEQQMLIAYLFRLSHQLDQTQRLELDIYASSSTPLWLYQEWLGGTFPMLTIALLCSMASGDWLEWPVNKEGWGSRRLNAINKLLDYPAGTAGKFYETALRLCGTETDFGLHNFSSASTLEHVSLNFASPSLCNDNAILQRDYSDRCLTFICNVATNRAPVRPANEATLASMLTDYDDPPMNDSPRSSISGLRSLRSILMRSGDLSSIRSRSTRRSSLGSSTFNPPISMNDNDDYDDYDHMNMDI